jgi:hypothetical protein
MACAIQFPIISMDEIVSEILYYIISEKKTPSGENIQFIQNHNDMFMLHKNNIKKNATKWLSLNEHTIANCDKQVTTRIEHRNIEISEIVNNQKYTSQKILNSLRDEFCNVFPYLRYMNSQISNIFWIHIVEIIRRNRDSRLLDF